MEHPNSSQFSLVKDSELFSLGKVNQYAQMRMGKKNMKKIKISSIVFRAGSNESTRIPHIAAHVLQVNLSMFHSVCIYP